MNTFVKIFFLCFAICVVANGANVMAKDDKGQIPLYHAISKDHENVAELLRKHTGETSEKQYFILEEDNEEDKREKHSFAHI